MYLSDTVLVSQLAQAKLDKAVAKLNNIGAWCWVESTLDRYGATEKLIALTPDLVGVPPAMTDKIEALEKQIMAWEDLYNDEALPEGFDSEAAFEKALEVSQRDLEKLEKERDTYLAFTDTQKAYSGCLVTFDRDGKLDIVEGLARRKDIPQAGTQQADTAGEGADSPMPQAAGLSQSLQADIGLTRQQITQAVLLKQPAAALDVLVYSQCMQILGDQPWRGRAMVSAHFNSVASATSRQDTQQGRAFDEIAAYRKTLPLAWLGIDFAAYWRPTRDNYFGRLSIAQLKNQLGLVMGQSWLDWHSDAKKTVIVDSLNAAFSESEIPADDPRRTWLPEGF